MCFIKKVPEPEATAEWNDGVATSTADAAASADASDSSDAGASQSTSITVTENADGTTTVTGGSTGVVPNERILATFDE